MSDKFVLTVGLAHQLQHGFDRNGWTVEEVNDLTKGDTLSVIREALFDKSELTDIAERQQELKRLITLKLRPVEETKALIESMGDATLEEVFNSELCEALGYPGRIRSRVLTCFAQWGNWSNEERCYSHSVTTLRQLLKPREQHSPRLPMGLGKQSEKLIVDVLARYGLRLP